MVQALLSEMGAGPFDEWVRLVIADGPNAGGAYPRVAALWNRFLVKVTAGEQWSLPDTSYGSKQRDVCISHPKEMIFALKLGMTEAKRDRGELVLENGHFQLYPAFGDVDRLLGQRHRARRQSSAPEGTRREKSLYDFERTELFASILRCDVERRQSVDALTLALICSLHSALGQRGMTIDAIRHSGLQITRWNTEMWPGVAPTVLQIGSTKKGAAANAQTDLFQVMHHRDGMRCPIVLLGHYLAFAMFEVRAARSQLTTKIPVLTHLPAPPRFSSKKRTRSRHRRRTTPRVS